MFLTLIRDRFYDKSTIGKLAVNGIFNCYILEPPAQLGPESTSVHIPYGTYRVKLRDSERFKRQVIAICDVPGRTDIEIHHGNFPKDTHGCLLPGKSREKNFVGESDMAFEFLFGLVKAALTRNEDVFIEIQATAADTDFHSEVKQGD